MNLLHKRPLASLAITFLLGSVFSFFFSDDHRLLFGGLSLVLSISLLFFKKVRRFSKNAFALFLALAISFLAFSLRPQAVEGYENEAVILTGTVKEVVREENGMATIYLLGEEINEESVYSLYPTLFSARIPSEDAVIGKRISLLAIFEIEEKEFSVESTFSIADGIVASCRSAIPVKSEEKYDSFLYSTSLFRRWLHERITGSIEGENGELIAELLFGNGDLSETTRLSFRRTGASHLLAISGMHLSILSYFLLFVLLKLRTPKTLRNGILVLFLLVYVALTGLQPSVVRAAIMTLISLFGYMIGRPYDSFTALSVTAMLMLLCTPYLICDAGFLLSVLATYGVVISVEWESKRTRALKKKPGKIHSYFFSAVLLSSAAVIATLPVTAVFFGEISLLSLPTNLAVSPFFSLLIMLSLLVVLFPVPPFTFLASGVASCAKFLLSLLAKYPHAVLSLSTPFAKVSLVLLFFVFAFLLFVPLKRKSLLCIPVLLSASVLLISFLSVPLRRNGKTTALYSTTGSGDVLLSETSDGCILIDGGMSKKPLTSFLYSAKESGITSLSAVILFSIDEESAERVKTISSVMNIESVYIPTDTSKPSDIENELLSASADVLATVRRYSPGEAFLVGGERATVHFRGTETDETVACISLVTGKAELLYLSTNYNLYDRTDVAMRALMRADAIIFAKQRGVSLSVVPYRNFSESLSHVIIGDSNLAAWQGNTAVSIMEKAEVVYTPAFHKFTIKT